MTEFYAYAGELLDRRRADPGEDLISTLIAAEEEGDRLSDVELVNLVLNVLVGGVDTTQASSRTRYGCSPSHPEQWALLAEQPELAPRAVDEVLRFEPITPFTARIAMEDVDLPRRHSSRRTRSCSCARSPATATGETRRLRHHRPSARASR